AGDTTVDLMPNIGTPYAPFRTVTAADERADICRDGEYFGLAAHDAAPAPFPSATLGGFGRVSHSGTIHQCFMDATFGPPAGVPIPLTYSNCPLSARMTDLNAWRWVYAEIPRSLAVGHPRFWWRFNTAGREITPGDESGDDEGLYLDDISFLVCRRP